MLPNRNVSSMRPKRRDFNDVTLSNIPICITLELLVNVIDTLSVSNLIIATVLAYR